MQARHELLSCSFVEATRGRSHGHLVQHALDWLAVDGRKVIEDRRGMYPVLTLLSESNPPDSELLSKHGGETRFLNGQNASVRPLGEGRRGQYVVPRVPVIPQRPLRRVLQFGPTTCLGLASRKGTVVDFWLLFSIEKNGMKP